MPDSRYQLVHHSAPDGSRTFLFDSVAARVWVFDPYGNRFVRIVGGPDEKSAVVEQDPPNVPMPHPFRRQDPETGR